MTLDDRCFECTGSYCSLPLLGVGAMRLITVREVEATGGLSYEWLNRDVLKQHSLVPLLCHTVSLSRPPTLSPAVIASTHRLAQPKRRPLEAKASEIPNSGLKDFCGANLRPKTSWQSLLRARLSATVAVDCSLVFSEV
eukprot:COSAG05_NODE_5245_length_1227_cov_1.273050_2_plen_139_part_00